MKTDFLKDLGLEKDVIDKIMAENGRDIEGYKTQVSQLETEKANLTQQLGDANKQIDSFKELDVDGIKAAADEYKAKFEAAEAKAKEDLERLQFDHALSSALTSAKARNTKAVAALLDIDALSMKDGAIVGLDEQIKQLKADNNYLFEADEPVPKIVAPTGGTAPTTDDAAIRAIMGLPQKE